MGTAATGGFGASDDRTSATAKGASAPRTAGDARTQRGTVSNTFYISYTGLRNRREDQDFIFDLINEGAGIEGGRQFDARVIPEAF